MIYSTNTFSVEKRDFDFGTIFGISLGERGRGRREIFIPCPERIKVCKGPNIGLEIGTSKSGRPRINKCPGGAETPLYLLVDSRCGYTRRGCGTIRVNKPEAVEVLAEGNSADGDAGRIGTAAAKVIRVKADCIIRVRYSGDFQVDFLVCNAKTGKVIKVTWDDVPLAVESGIQFPLDWSVQLGPALDVNWKKI